MDALCKSVFIKIKYTDLDLRLSEKTRLQDAAKVSVQQAGGKGETEITALDQKMTKCIKTISG